VLGDVAAKAEARKMLSGQEAIPVDFESSTLSQ
jgi:hypothetical protein